MPRVLPPWPIAGPRGAEPLPYAVLSQARFGYRPVTVGVRIDSVSRLGDGLAYASAGRPRATALQNRRGAVPGMALAPDLEINLLPRMRPMTVAPELARVSTGGTQ